MFKRFIKDTSGNFAIIAAVSMMMLMVGAGAASDYSGMVSKRDKYQNLADAAVLAAATSGETRRRRLQQIAEISVEENNLLGESLTTELSLTRQGRLQVIVKGEYDPIILDIFGYEKKEIASLAQAPLPASEPVNIVLVLDTTFSMSGAKITSLKSAVNGLLTKLDELNSDNIKVSVIPFAQHINVGLSRRNEAWLDIGADTNTPLPDSCYFPVIGQTNCRMENYSATPARPAVPAGTCYNDGVPYACGGSAHRPAVPGGRREVCDNVYDTVQTCSPRFDTATWNGCVGSRASPWNTRHRFSRREIPGLMDVSCGTEILPLTTDIGAAKATVDSLTAVGETYLPSGLLWGWRALRPNPPLTEARGRFRRNRRNVMILMTDGANTQSKDGAMHDGGDGNTANVTSRRLCRALNDDDVEIYSIAYDMRDVTAKTILQRCATERSRFFDAANAAQLNDAFEKIAADLIKVRLTL